MKCSEFIIILIIFVITSFFVFDEDKAKKHLLQLEEEMKEACMLDEAAPP